MQIAKLSILATCFLGNLTAVAVAATPLMMSTLQTFYTADRKDAFTVEMYYSVNETQQGQLSHYTFSKIKLVVSRYPMATVGTMTVCEISYPGVRFCSGTFPTPVWSSGRVNDNFALPSGRVFQTPQGDVILCVCDANQWSLRKYDSAKASFVATDEAPFKPYLKSQYSSVFAVDDIYWSYSLVTSPQLWSRSPSDNLPKDLSRRNLYENWKILAKME